MRDEARMLGMLRHRTIVQADDLITLSGRPAVVMEYIPGVNFSTLINPQIFEDDLPPRVSLTAIRQVADALDVAYNRPSTVTDRALQVLHRDIKPANVRITPDGEVKVLDFGIARSDHMDREAETQEYQLGSLPYMAPELLDGSNASPSSDVYSLGVTFYECLARKRFGWAGEAEDLHSNQIETRLGKVDLTPFGDQAEQVYTLISRMIAFDTNERPTANEVARTCRDIERKVEGVGIEEWAPDAIPTVQDKEELDDGDLSGRTLFEDSSSAQLPRRPRDLLDDSTLQLGLDSAASTMAMPTEEELEPEPAPEPSVPQVEASPPAPGNKVRDTIVLALLLVVTCVVAMVFISNSRTKNSMPTPPAQTQNTQSEDKLMEAKVKEMMRKASAEQELEKKEEIDRQVEAALAAKAQSTAQTAPSGVDKPASTAPRTSRPRTAPKPVAAAPVPIRISSSPMGVSFSIDGGPKKIAPAQGIEILPGTHTLVFQHGDVPFTTTINVVPGKKSHWKYSAVGTEGKPSLD